MRICMLLVFSLVAFFMMSAQDTDKKEKVISVDVRKGSDSERTVKIVIDDNGDGSIIEWSDDGDIPADVRKKLEAAGIDVKMLDGDDDSDDQIIEIVVEGDDDGGENIWIEKDGDRVHRIRKRMVEEKAYKMVIIDEDGNEKVIEWEGDGEMPEEMREMMKEHEMEIHEVHGNKKKVKIRKHQTKEGLHRDHEEMYFDGRSGRRMGPGPGGNVFFMADGDRTAPMTNTYMGAQIGPVEDGDFVVVQEIIKDGPADKAGLARGDEIHRINGARTRTVDGMMTLLGMFEPDDKIDMTVKRDGKERSIKVTLAKRPNYYK